jgi:hypothetical protein
MGRFYIWICLSKIELLSHKTMHKLTRGFDIASLISEKLFVYFDLSDKRPVTVLPAQ